MPLAILRGAQVDTLGFCRSSFPDQNKFLRRLRPAAPADNKGLECLSPVPPVESNPLEYLRAMPPAKNKALEYLSLMPPAKTSGLECLRPVPPAENNALEYLSPMPPAESNPLRCLSVAIQTGLSDFDGSLPPCFAPDPIRSEIAQLPRFHLRCRSGDYPPGGVNISHLPRRPGG